MQSIFAITFPIFALIALGFAMVRGGVFAKAEMRVLGRLVINLALPALIFQALSERPLAEILNFGYLAAYALGSLAVLALAVGAAHFLRKKPLQVAAVHGMGTALSNSGFVGYAIVSQLLGPPAAVALVLCLVVENVLILPLALALAENGAQANGKGWAAVLATLRSLLKNPLILAILAGFAFALLDIHPPRPIARGIAMIAMASAPLALFVIGGTLVGLRLRGMGRDVAQVVVGKLVLHPLAVAAALVLLPPIDPALRVAAIAFASMPMLSIYPILAMKYGQEEFCAAALLAATVCAFFTISAVLGLLGGMPA